LSNFYIFLGIIFFIPELKVASYGLLSIAGSTSIVIAAVVAFSIIFFVGVLSYAVKAQFSKVKTGREGLIGETGVARTDISHAGKAFVHGELWDAYSDTPIRAGERVLVAAVEGMTVKVEKAGGA
jgi:membrane-bound serine protease (ClpP class)